MSLFKKKSKENARTKRLYDQFKATTQNTLRFESLAENGQMLIKEGRYSHMYRLGDTSYTTSNEDNKLTIIDTYANALNGLEVGTTFQLFLIQRQISKEKMASGQYPLEQDHYDVYRQEYNDLMATRFEDNKRAFELHKYMTIAMSGVDDTYAIRQFNDVSTRLSQKFNQMGVSVKHLNGIERLELFASILREMSIFPYAYEDIAMSGLHEKSFIAPNFIHIHKNYLEIDNQVAKIKYIRHFPRQMSDRLISELSKLDMAFVFSFQATMTDTSQSRQEIMDAGTDADIALIKAQKRASASGVLLSDKYIGSAIDKEHSEVSEEWLNELRNDQKIYKGLITILLMGESLDDIAEQEHKLSRVGSELGIIWDDMYYYQEEALNTVLPIGDNFVDVRQPFSRKMTTANVATQVPFTHVELISDSSKALYYGQNQLSKHMITLDRKKDLLTGSGVILGISGSGKSFAVKLNELIPNLLRYPDDRTIIVDPEDEYSDIGEQFNAQAIDLSLGSHTHINVLDLPDTNNLIGREAKDPIGNKADLLIHLFETILEDLSDVEVTLIDRATRQVYAEYDKPTLKEWHAVLLKQPEEEAQELALKVEIYTIGSQNLFSHQTNVNLTNRLVIFNLKYLTGKLKPLALLVVQDFIWNQVVNNKGKLTTWLYFDELQLYFRTEAQAIFFTELYSRVRKYGAIPTGITQNAETIYAVEEGRKLLSNSEFMMILKQKDTDIKVLNEILTLTDEQIRYISQPKEPGMGIIYAGGVIVPFENPIPKHTELYQLIETDA